MGQESMDSKFEDFSSTFGKEDIFHKVFELSKALNLQHPNPNDALGTKLLSAATPEVTLLERGGQRHRAIMLGSNSYFNFTTHPDVKKAAADALKKYGYGMGAVSVYAGATDLHRELELMIANFHGCEDAIVFPNGYACNFGIISALCGVGDVVINDSANHASIFDGCKLSGAETKVYPHNNMRALERILSKIPSEVKGRLIITDGVFSMYGDIAPLDKIVELARKYNARIMVDDAHGIGIIGKTGRGSAEYFNVMKDIDLNVGMLSKTPGGIGGYCAAKSEVIQYLRLFSRPYFFSTALPAPIVAGLIEVFKILSNNEAGRKKLWENINYFKSLLLERGFNLPNTESGIVPIVIGDEPKLIELYKDLVLSGVYANIVTYPAVRRKECRVRFCIMKELTKVQLESAVEIIAKVAKKHGII